MNSEIFEFNRFPDKSTSFRYQVDSQQPTTFNLWKDAIYVRQDLKVEDLGMAFVSGSQQLKSRRTLTRNLYPEMEDPNSILAKLQRRFFQAWVVGGFGMNCGHWGTFLMHLLKMLSTMCLWSWLVVSESIPSLVQGGIYVKMISNHCKNLGNFLVNLPANKCDRSGPVSLQAARGASGYDLWSLDGKSHRASAGLPRLGACYDAHQVVGHSWPAPRIISQF